MGVTPPPNPVTGTETYLAAIYDRLGHILDRLPPRPVEDLEPGTVELREPAPQSPAPVQARRTSPMAKPTRGTRRPSTRAKPPAKTSEVTDGNDS